MALNVKEMLFALVAYALLKAEKIKAGAVVVALWIVVKVAYGIAVLVFEPFSSYTASILVGQCFMVAVLGFFLVKEVGSKRLESNAT